MEIQVEMLPNYRVAYARQVGPYGPGNIRAMEQVKDWARRNGLLTDSAILFGVPQDNPETTAPENCRYDACIVLPQGVRADGALREAELAGGKYVVCKIRHTAEEVQRAWREIFPFIQSGGYRMDDKPIVERYAGVLLHDDYCELCVPIRPL